MPQPFVVFCEARTGSYSLVSRLSSCPDIVCYDEIFKKQRIELPAQTLGRLRINTWEARNRDPLGFIEELRALEPAKHFGFKLFNHHLRWAPPLEGYLESDAVLKVLLCRDPREVYASSMRIRETGVWTVRKGQRRRDPGDVQVTYSEESFEPFLQHYNRFLERARAFAGRPDSFVIHYEQINDSAALDALLAFLGSATRAPATSTEFEKQFKGDLEDGFSNWEAFAERLAREPRPLERPLPSFRAAERAEVDADAPNPAL